MKTALLAMFVFSMFLLINTVNFQTFAEEVQDSFIIVDSQEIQRPNSVTGVEILTTTGHVENYSRGNIIELLIISPSGELDELSIYASKDGEFFTIINVGINFEVGEYELVLYYDGIKEATTTFNVI